MEASGSSSALRFLDGASASASLADSLSESEESESDPDAFFSSSSEESELSESSESSYSYISCSSSHDGTVGKIGVTYSSLGDGLSSTVDLCLTGIDNLLNLLGSSNNWLSLLLGFGVA